MGMKRLFIVLALLVSFALQPLASDHTALARVTVYWPGEGSGKSAAWNGARLNENHCAVDPKKIPYGSKVLFDEGECMAVDTGPDVVKRTAAVSLGRSKAQRNAIVIDRFFDTRQRARAWESSHPHFMVVRVQTADTKQAAN
jgi:3D (Asp-Asp-Asp) domain-containing protein